MIKLKKTCFLITPLGENDSFSRLRADAICGELIQPLIDKHDLQLVRGDGIPEQGNVMVQVVREILDSALIVADLTGLNPNVLYELGIADAFRKSVLRLVDDPKCLPFDFRGDRTIPLRSTKDGNLVSEDVRAAQPSISQFITDSLHWNHDVSNSVSDAIKQLPVGYGEVGLLRMVGGYQLAQGWSGVEKALKAAGCDITLLSKNAPETISLGPYSVNLVGALISDTAEIQLSFGDWMEEDVQAYLRDLAKVLVDCGSPYRLVASHCGTHYIAEPGELLDGPCFQER